MNTDDLISSPRRGGDFEFDSNTVSRPHLPRPRVDGAVQFSFCEQAGKAIFDSPNQEFGLL
jgi:hypothetical protein